MSISFCDLLQMVRALTGSRCIPGHMTFIETARQESGRKLMFRIVEHRLNPVYQVANSLCEGTCMFLI